MEYYLDNFTPDPTVGVGETLEQAIGNALEIWLSQISLDEGNSWAQLYLKMAFMQRKAAIFSQVENFDPIEIAEMNAEARDYAITGNTTPARYPLANGLATARGLTLISVLTAWRNAFAAAYAQLATLIHQYETAKSAADASATVEQLQSVMRQVLLALES